jgi:DNA-binding SARP family transcriptional activator
VLDVGVSDLAFSVTEVGDLVRAGQIDASDDLVVAIHRVTGGWPAAVRLAIEAASRHGASARDRARLVEDMTRTGGPLFRYLAGEIFGREPDAVRQLLRTVAPVGQFTLELLAILGVHEAAATTESLVRRGLFVEQDGDWFSLHDLARDYATQAWPLSTMERRVIFRGVSGWHAGAGRQLQALEALAAAGDLAGLAAGIERHGSALVRSGDARQLLALVALLPEDLRVAHIEQLTGEAHAMLGAPLTALAAFGRAARKPGGDNVGLAWRRAMSYYLHDDLEAVIGLFEAWRGTDLVGADGAMLLAWVASAHRRLGNGEEARLLAQRALAAAVAANDDRALAAAHTAVALIPSAEGGATAHLKTALAAATRGGDIHQETRIRINAASDLLEQCAYADSIRELGVALASAELAGFTSLAALALMNRGLARWCLGQLDEASRDYEAAVNLYRSAGSQELSYALIGRGDVHRERGHIELARAAYEEGLALAEVTGDRQALVPALYQLSKVVAADAPAEAALLADRAVGFGWPDQAWALNAKGWIAHMRGDVPTALAASREAAAIARQLEDWYGLAEALELQGLSASDPQTSISQFEAALAIWRRLGNELHEAGTELAIGRFTGGRQGRLMAEAAELRLRAMGIQPNPVGPAGLITAVAGRAAEPVSVRSLGGFGVARFGDPVALPAWQSKKARDLLKMLVARRGRPVTRDELFEQLWPDEPDSTGNRLSVALSILRGVLDPTKRFDADHFVTTDRTAIWLNLDSVAIDVEAFMVAVEHAAGLRRQGRTEAAIDALHVAEATYTGDFLEENPYDDWTVGLREQVRAAYLDTARALAADADRRHDHAASVRFRLRILERDPFDEQSHLALVTSLVRGGRHGEARRAYALYLRRMRELGIEGSPFPDELEAATERSRP